MFLKVRPVCQPLRCPLVARDRGRSVVPDSEQPPGTALRRPRRTIAVRKLKPMGATASAATLLGRAERCRRSRARRVAPWPINVVARHVRAAF
ncbi:unnamed protein product, partial [Amoebophrya sp. A120]|eukprot:GSA120T00008748001.1